MIISLHRLTGVAILAALIAAPVFAQGTIPSVGLMEVNATTLAMGYRTTKVVGASVVNEANETIGKIDDLIVTPDAKVPYAVVSVGGFLGMGSKLVVVSSSSLEVGDKKMVLHGATKDSLKALPDFKFTN